jgi:hypothetical protein
LAFWYSVWQFGIVCGPLVYFSQFGMFGPRKIWQPCLGCICLAAMQKSSSWMFCPKKTIHFFLRSIKLFLAYRDGAGMWVQYGKLLKKNVFRLNGQNFSIKETPKRSQKGLYVPTYVAKYIGIYVNFIIR